MRSWSKWKTFSRKWKSSSSDGPRSSDLEAVLIVGDGHALLRRQAALSAGDSLVRLSARPDIIDELADPPLIRRGVDRRASRRPSRRALARRPLRRPRGRRGAFVFAGRFEAMALLNRRERIRRPPKYLLLRYPATTASIPPPSPSDAAGASSPMTGLGRRSDRLEPAVSTRRQPVSGSGTGSRWRRRCRHRGRRMRSGTGRTNVASARSASLLAFVSWRHNTSGRTRSRNRPSASAWARRELTFQVRPEIDPVQGRSATSRFGPRGRRFVVVGCAPGPRGSPPSLPRRDRRSGLAVAAVALARFHRRLRPLADVLLQRPADVRARGEPTSIIPADESLVAAVEFHNLTFLGSHCHSLRCPLDTRIAVSACLRSSTAQQALQQVAVSLGTEEHQHVGPHDKTRLLRRNRTPRRSRLTKTTIRRGRRRRHRRRRRERRPTHTCRHRRVPTPRLSDGIDNAQPSPPDVRRATNLNTGACGLGIHTSSRSRSSLCRSSIRQPAAAWSMAFDEFRKHQRSIVARATPTLIKPGPNGAPRHADQCEVASEHMAITSPADPSTDTASNERETMLMKSPRLYLR